MLKNFWSWAEDFIGALVFHATQASGSGHALVLTDTSAAGAPVVEVVDGATAGELKIGFGSTTEVQNACLSFGDKLAFDIDLIRSFRARIKAGQATIDSASSFAIGLAGDRNDAIDSIAQHLLFRLIGTNEVMIETDDGTTDLDDKATGVDVDNSAWVDLYIDLSNKADVKFYVGGQPVCTGTTFDVSGYSGALQPYIQAQKTSDANEDYWLVDYIEVDGVRSLPSAT